jgi:hypothetical protein
MEKKPFEKLVIPAAIMGFLGLIFSLLFCLLLVMLPIFLDSYSTRQKVEYCVLMLDLIFNSLAFSFGIVSIIQISRSKGQMGGKKIALITVIQSFLFYFFPLILMYVTSKIY